jgi:hypothetical protein
MRMKFKKKARGLMIVEVIVGLAMVGSAIPAGAHIYAGRRAEDRLQVILSNLAGIDGAVAQWDGQHRGVKPDRHDLDGSGGSIALDTWPVGPVQGTYAISDREYLTWSQIRRDAMPACATFDAGAKRPMNRAEWQRTCSADPISCGL